MKVTHDFLKTFEHTRSLLSLLFMEYRSSGAEIEGYEDTIAEAWRSMEKLRIMMEVNDSD